MPETPPPHPGKGRTPAGGVTVHPRPAGLAGAARKAPPVLALCLHLDAPTHGFAPQLVSCSLAANFGPEAAAAGPPGPIGPSGAAESGGATVAVIRPVRSVRKPAPWRPGLAQLIGLALREAGADAGSLGDGALVVAVCATPPDGPGAGHLFSPELPAASHARPVHLRLRVPDFRGRVYAADVEVRDLTAVAARGGLGVLAHVLRPVLMRPGSSWDTSVTEGDGPGLGEERALEAEAHPGRLLLYYAAEVLLPRLGRPVDEDDC